MTLDLSAVTDSLLGLVKNQWTTAPIWTEVAGSPPAPTFTPSFTGLAPDAARQAPGPQLALYLYHVEPDNAREALFWQPQLPSAPGGEPTRFLPLALDLYYLLFAYSETSYTEEQEAMSVALRTFHANPIVRSDPGAATPWELTLTMEHRSYDEMSLLWQATTAPLRMSQVYRAAVMFIDPDPAPAAATPASSFSVSVNPLPSAGPARLPGRLRHRQGRLLRRARRPGPVLPVARHTGGGPGCLAARLGPRPHRRLGSRVPATAGRRRRDGHNDLGDRRRIQRGHVRAPGPGWRRGGTRRAPPIPACTSCASAAARRARRAPPAATRPRSASRRW